MRSTKSISLFPVQSITSAEFRWLHTEGWDDKHFEFFWTNRNQFNFSHFQVGLKQKQPEDSIPLKPERWILDHHNESDDCQGFIEAIKIPGSFSRTFIIVYFKPHVDHHAWQNRAFVHLISALVIAAQLDVFYIEALDSHTQAQLSRLIDWPGPQQVVSIRLRSLLWASPQRTPIVTRNVTKFDRHQWEERPDVAEELKRLSYLERRLERQSRPTLKQALQNPRTRGLFSIFKRR